MDEFKRIVLYMAPRILGLMDRIPGSSTFGCCDRYYWQYKLHDVSNARLQEACLFLALLYKHDFEGNMYYGNPVVKQWALASVKFWEKLVSSHGGVAEVYPFERSYCATSFSTFAALETLIHLSQTDQGNNFQQKITKIGYWLMAHPNTDVTNQMASAALALHTIAQCTQKDVFRAASDELIDKIISRYKEDGCFVEYGGFDTGYTSITNSLLGWHGEHVHYRPGLRECMLHSQARIDSQTGPEGDYPFADKSRRTQFLYPYGFFVMQSPVFGKILKGVAANAIITPLWMDDRYCIPLSTDYLMTLDAAAPTKEAKT